MYTITFGFDHRKMLNTAGNIGSLFEHEHRGHGVFELRTTSKFDPHPAIYRMQQESPIYKYTSGAYREHIDAMNKHSNTWRWKTLDSHY